MAVIDSRQRSDQRTDVYSWSVKNGFFSVKHQRNAFDPDDSYFEMCSVAVDQINRFSIMRYRSRSAIEMSSIDCKNERIFEADDIETLIKRNGKNAKSSVGRTNENVYCDEWSYL